MTITYTWTIDSLPNYPSAEGQENVVFQVNWTLTGTDGTYTANEKGGTGVTYNAGQPYTPYNQLTQEIVLGWVQSTMPPETLALYEGWIADSIEQQKNQKVTPPPWSN
jgi:hypothetical protein